MAAAEKIRSAIPLGGNFHPSPEEGIFVASGHGMNVVVSRDDGKTWQQVFTGGLGGDHGHWAVYDTVAYTKGVFAVGAGWGAPGTIIASDDGQNWRHLTAGSNAKKGSLPYDMPWMMQLIGVDGAFVMPLDATTDFGKTWFHTSSYGVSDADGKKGSVDIPHAVLASGEHAGHKRVIVIGDKGPGAYSDDLGKTWVSMKVKAEPWEEGHQKGIIAKGNVFIIMKGNGKTVLRSTDGGMTWQSHPLGVERPAGRSYALSIVKDEFWVTGKNSKASKDGITWRDLPASTPQGRTSVSDKGTLINVLDSRPTILRSTDGEKWDVVHTFQMAKGYGAGSRLSGVAFGKVRAVR